MFIPTSTTTFIPTSTTSIPINQLPICNSMINGQQQYDSNSLQTLADGASIAMTFLV